MVVRRPEGVLLDGPARREDDEVGDGHARSSRLARQHRENGRILSKRKTDFSAAPLIDLCLLDMANSMVGDSNV